LYLDVIFYRGFAKYRRCAKTNEIFEILSAEEEVELSRRARNGDIEARNSLVLHNQQFLIKLVNSFSKVHPELEKEDLYSEANIGLIRAAELFDPEKEVRFVWYAKFWIMQALFRYEEENTGSLRLPSNKAQALNRIKFAMDKAKTEDPEIISSKTGIDIETVKELLPLRGKAVSLDAPLCSEEGIVSKSLSDLVCVYNEIFDSFADYDELNRMLSALSERQREVILSRYGASGRKKKTLQEIADSYGVTRERIRQIEKQAIRNCRKAAAKRP